MLAGSYPSFLSLPCSNVLDLPPIDGVSRGDHLLYSGNARLLSCVNPFDHPRPKNVTAKAGLISFQYTDMMRERPVTRTFEDLATDIRAVSGQVWRPWTKFSLT